MQIVLSAHVVGLSFFELGMRGGKLSLRGDDSRLSVFNIGSGELELAGRVTVVIGTVTFSDWSVASAFERLACACATATS
jgi:hypothetical protein